MTHYKLKAYPHLEYYIDIDTDMYIYVWCAENNMGRFLIQCYDLKKHDKNI